MTTLSAEMPAPKSVVLSYQAESFTHFNSHHCHCCFQILKYSKTWNGAFINFDAIFKTGVKYIELGTGICIILEEIPKWLVHQSVVPYLRIMKYRNLLKFLSLQEIYKEKHSVNLVLGSISVVTMADSSAVTLSPSG